MKTRMKKLIGLNLYLLALKQLRHFIPETFKKNKKKLKLPHPKKI
jgi:hypothetical protein